MSTNSSKQAFFSKQVSRSRVFFREEEKVSELNLVSGGCEHCSPDYLIERNTFPYFCVELVVKGRGEIMIGKRSQQQLLPGSVFIYGPDVPYRMCSSKDFPMVKYFVDFNGNRALPLLKNLQLTAGCVIQIPPSKVIIETLDQLIDVGLEHTAYASRLGVLLLEILLVRFADSSMPSGSMATRAYATYQRCRSYIEANSLKLRTVDEVAKACNLDLSYLCRLFQRFAHKSPYQIMTDLKMNAATERLVQSDCLIKEVADEFGFADAYHFSRMFKQFHGLAPQQFLQKRKRLHFKPIDLRPARRS